MSVGPQRARHRLDDQISTTIKPARWYFLLRAVAAIVDYAIYGVFYFAYVRYFGSETDEGYRVSGCGHVIVLIGI